jgi:hypothetical protein
MVTEAFVGIDVAFAKRKRLPMCICVREGKRLRLVPLKERGLPKPPAGRGNRAALEQREVEQFALEVLSYLRVLEQRLGLSIKVIALDCPRRPKKNGTARRAADAAMDACGISCFATPSQAEFEAIREKVKAFLRDGGAESKMPNANQLWMLVGFRLFSVLEKHYECREVFPQAIIARLDRAAQHKSTSDGYSTQLAAAARVTGTSADKLAHDLHSSVYGLRHDRLDAYFSAWIASLPISNLEACGKLPWDAIWVPKIHQTSLSPRHVVSKVLAVCEKLVKIHGTVQAGQWLIDLAWSIVGGLGNFLMPEDFWYGPFKRGDQADMVSQLERSRKSKWRLIKRAEGWSPREQAAILEVFDRLNDRLSLIEEEGIRRAAPNPAA